MWKLRKLNSDHGYAAMVGAVISVLVSIIVGILIYYKIAASAGQTNAAAIAALAGVNTTANTVFTLAPIVGIVMIAGIILAIVTNFGRGSA